MLPNEAQWQSFYVDFKRIADLDLSLYKADQLRRRIIGMVESKNMASLDEFSAWLKQGKMNVEWFQDKLAINVSELFRNPEKWVEIENKILPELLQKSQNLNCWSAGCSYGAEAHTLATILEAKFKGNHKILGTDIDMAALTQARAGEFSDTDMIKVPPAWRDTYFEKKGEVWLAKPAIKKYCTFESRDLLKDMDRSSFDLIMCRNVVIYFTDSAKNKLYERFYNALRPGGYLLVGSTERIFNSKELGFESPMPFFYRKPMQGGEQWRNAS